LLGHRVQALGDLLYVRAQIVETGQLGQTVIPNTRSNSCVAR